MKKLLVIMLIVVLLVSVCPFGLFTFSANAVARGITGDCEWTLEDTVLTISGNGKMGDYEHYVSLPWGRAITKVVIEKGVTNIGYAAFENCNKLTTVVISDSVTAIDAYAFNKCTSLKNVNFGNCVSTISIAAFYGCTSLENLLLPDSVTGLGSYAFTKCSSIKDIVLSKNISNIPMSAFYGCKNLESVTFGEKIKTICYYSFYGCNALTDVYFGGDQTAQQKVAVNKSNATVLSATWHCGDVEPLTYAYNDNDKTAMVVGCYKRATSVAIPTRVTKAGKTYKVTSVNSYAFSKCTSLESVNFGYGVSTIGMSAFYGCTNLSSVTFGTNLTSIGYYAFYGCNSLTDVYFKATAKEKKTIVNSSNSQVVNATWHYDDTYCPKIYFTGNIEGMQEKSDVREIQISYVNDSQIINGYAELKVQGTSSLAYDKKNYTITFYKADDFDKKMKVDFGWGAQSKYCMKANWIDKTHSRNVVTAKLAGEVQRKYSILNIAPNNGAVDGFPIEVYVNGEFHGVYTMNIPKDEWQFGMDKDNPDHIVICGENWSDVVKFYAMPTDFEDWSVEAGPETDETLEKIQRLCSFVMNSSSTKFKSQFGEYLDLDSTLNYYIMVDVAYLGDNVGKNMLLATYDGKVWYPSLYDLDASFGADYTGNKEYNYKDKLLYMGNSFLWARVEYLFKPELAARYFELRESILNKEHIMEMFNTFYGSIPEAALEREKENWETETSPIPGFDLEQIESYLDNILPRLDAKYSSWLQ